MSCAGYLAPAFSVERRKRIIRELLERIEQTGLQFDAIAFRGMSGALIAPCVADRLNKPLMMVRKEQDGSHSGIRVEYEEGIKIKSYIIIDDLISSGTTIKKIRKVIEERLPNAKPLAVFLYNRNKCSSAQTDMREIKLSVYYIESEKEEGDEQGVIPKKNKVRALLDRMVGF